MTEPSYTANFAPDESDKPLAISVSRAAALIGVGLPAIETARFGDTLHIANFELGIPAEAHEWLKADASNLIIDAAFGELMRGMRSSLEQAWVHCRAYHERNDHPRDMPKFIKGLEHTANGMKMPDLLARLDKVLRRPLALSAEVASFQRVRNCIEHRAGIVGKKDAEAGELRLSFPALAFLVPDETGELVEWDPAVHRRSINAVLARGRREISFAEGDRIKFSAIQLASILHGCTQIGSDLRLALPSQPEGAGDMPLIQVEVGERIGFKELRRPYL